MKRVQSFTLKKLNEKSSWSLAQVKNKPIMLTFWTTWCPDSLHDLQSKQLLFEKMNEEKLEMVMIHVSGRDPDADLKLFLRENHYTFPVILDEGTAIYERFQCAGVPTTILLNKNHEIVQQYGERATMIDIMQGLTTILN